MNRFRLLVVAIVAVSTLAFGGLGATAASAKTSAESFAGRYILHFALGGGSVRAPIRLNGDGTGTLGLVGVRWTSAGKTITITFSDATITETFVGNLTEDGIATEDDPGTLTTNVASNGVWYAVKSD